MMARAAPTLFPLADIIPRICIELTLTDIANLFVDRATAAQLWSLTQPRLNTSCIVTGDMTFEIIKKTVMGKTVETRIILQKPDTWTFAINFAGDIFSGFLSVWRTQRSDLRYLVHVYENISHHVIMYEHPDGDIWIPHTCKSTPMLDVIARIVARTPYGNYDCELVDLIKDSTRNEKLILHVWRNIFGKNRDKLYQAICAHDCKNQ